MIEQKYIGRYGEILENVQECSVDYLNRELSNITKLPSSESLTEDRITMHGWGINKNGERAHIIFQVSKKTGKKEGCYIVDKYVTYKNGFQERLSEISYYQIDLLNGREYHYDSTGRQTIAEWHLGKKTNLDKRRIAAKNVTVLRQLFSDTSVKKIISSGDIVKIKSALTRALKKRELGE